MFRSYKTDKVSDHYKIDNHMEQERFLTASVTEFGSMKSVE